MPGPLHGQIKLDDYEQPLSAETPPVPRFRIKAPTGNKQPVWIGNTGVNEHNGFALDPGDQLDYECPQNAPRLRPSDFFAVGAKGDRVTWIAPPGG